MVQGDTDRIKSGAGTGGSSSIPVGGVSSTVPPRRWASSSRTLAADALEASAGDLEIADGTVRVAGTDRAISFADLAAHPSATPEKLNAAEEFSVEPPTYPNGTHIAEVEIDPDTGATSHSSITSSLTISARRSIRCCSPARCMAARCRASARR